MAALRGPALDDHIIKKRLRTQTSIIKCALCPLRTFLL